MESIDERFKQGVELFNKGEFFECHEVIEDLWLKTKGPYRDFYKGIIQAAVALHHLKKENLTGAKELFKSSTKYLEKYCPTVLGLDVVKLIKDMKTCFERDRNLIPKLEFQEPKSRR